MGFVAGFVLSANNLTQKGRTLMTPSRGPKSASSASRRSGQRDERHRKKTEEETLGAYPLTIRAASRRDRRPVSDSKKDKPAPDGQESASPRNARTFADDPRRGNQRPGLLKSLRG